MHGSKVVLHPCFRLQGLKRPWNGFHLNGIASDTHRRRRAFPVPADDLQGYWRQARAPPPPIPIVAVSKAEKALYEVVSLLE